ncbi:MAG: DUF72 domain-containing protein [Candidatus Thermoplasmatota archaeon]|jgi:uncharacterized protein YecE (DUF72 family)|nr:DUF72 domain-containing protein [Candidatus Thermoplasmatota archaeon]
MGKIKVGSSGWSYKDWVGPFYPAGSRDQELLSIYFSRMSTVEVNTTFYNIPQPGTVKKWGSEAARWPGREICVKVPGKASHEAAMDDGPEGLRKVLSEFDRTVLRPLFEAGVLGAVLFQASPYFTLRGDIKYKMKSEPVVPIPKYTMGIKRLGEVLDALSSLPGDQVLELRHSSWLDEENRLIGEARDLLRSRGVALAVVDGPSFPWLEEATSRHNYFRFHGRNRSDWFKGGERDPTERYDYRYSPEELEQRAPRIRVIDSIGDKGTRVMFNNHPRGNAPMNALEMMELLGVGPLASAFEGFA